MTEINVNQIKGLATGGGGTGAGPQGSPGVTGPTGPAGPQGSPGVTGVTGPSGQNAFNNTPTFIQNNATSVSVLSGAYGGWEQIGQAVYIGTAGYYVVTGITGSNLILGNLASNLPSGTIINASEISPAGLPGIQGPSGTGSATGFANTSLLRFYVFMGT